MFSVVCEKCDKQFETLHKERESNICYGCALNQLCGRSAPEEGDFNSARIISDEMTEQEERWLREDLEAVESGRSIREPYYEEDNEDHYGPITDFGECNDTDEVCQDCGWELSGCICYSDDEE